MVFNAQSTISVISGGGEGVAQWLERLNSNPKTLHVFDPLEVQGDRRVVCPSESTVEQTCLCLAPLRVTWHAPTFVRMLKIPYPCVVKVYRPHSRWYGNTIQHCTQAEKSLVAPYPGKAAAISRTIVCSP